MHQLAVNVRTRACTCSLWSRYNTVLGGSVDIAIVSVMHTGEWSISAVWSCCGSMAMATKENLRHQRGMLGSIQQKVTSLGSILLANSRRGGGRREGFRGSMALVYTRMREAL